MQQGYSFAFFISFSLYFVMTYFQIQFVLIDFFEVDLLVFLSFYILNLRSFF